MAAESTEAVESKICVIGDSGVGKTSLVLRYVSGTFNPAVDSTIGASFMTKRITLGESKLKLQIWDTAGQERFRSMAPMFYRGCSAAVVVFDVTSEPSFESMKGWVTELQQNVGLDVLLYVVGNKTDLNSKRRVDGSAAQTYADTVAAMYAETSAKNNDGIDALFKSVGMDLIAKSRGQGRVVQNNVVQVQEKEDPPRPLDRAVARRQRVVWLGYADFVLATAKVF